MNGNGRELDGFSLRGLLENPSGNKWAGPPVAVTALASNARLEPNQPAPPQDQHYSIRSERYRYVICRNGDDELYDHLSDPFEWYNLADKEQYAPVVQYMRREFLRIIETRN
jgi:iduronate 2-sulfatase